MHQTLDQIDIHDDSSYTMERDMRSAEKAESFYVEDQTNFKGQCYQSPETTSNTSHFLLNTRDSSRVQSKQRIR